MHYSHIFKTESLTLSFLYYWRWGLAIWSPMTAKVTLTSSQDTEIERYLP